MSCLIGLYTKCFWFLTLTTPVITKARFLWLNTLRPRQNVCHLAVSTFKYIFLNENVIISAKISLRFVPKGPINIIPALVQIMAWRRPGDKPLSEPMMVRLPTRICVTRPQWVNKVSANAGRCYITHIKGSMQDCSNSIANTLDSELLQSCTKP